MLKNFGFGTAWTKWIKGCISSARVSVLVNGSPLPEFCPQKGLRQGISVGDAGFNVSHLQFVDDTVIFCEAEWSEILAIKRILRCFEVISSLRINFYKSVVCGVGVADELVEEFAAKLNCLSKKLPLKYLGLPLGASPSRRLTWRPVVENFKKKLSSWKRRILSFAGIVTHIKSVLSALPVYYMSFFKMPECVSKEIDRIQASFLWGDSEYNRKLHLVQWKEEDEALWKIVICGKYGSIVGRWFPDQIAHGHVMEKGLVSGKIFGWVQQIYQVARRSSQFGWGFNFRKALRAWEEGELDRFIIALGSGPVLRSDSADCLGWKSLQSGTFHIHLVYD
ncbi:uncharacterized protein LOC114272052 [Camellia sinensis]|uniref:uncharacterized protein LOC114272052 n=1 Tax=Camellia sinensis TaxID=4442 RepID=UPI001036349C|nr:uncharacterized protein LOC114272052 [Camellia sinensis]